jgi:hypothetical protein
MDTPVAFQRVATASALLLVLVLFVCLRWDSWPKTYFADELIPLAVVKHMEVSGTLDSNWDHADWRGDFAGGVYDLQQYNFSSYHVTLRAIKAGVSALGVSPPDITLFRICSLVFQCIATLLIGQMLWRHVDAGTALAAVGFLSVMPQAVIDAHYARPEAFVTLLVAACVWLGWRVCAQSIPRVITADVMSALLWGVAFACKISLLPMAIMAWLCLLWRGVRGGWLIGWWLCFCAGFALSAPAAFTDPVGFLHGAGILFTQYGTAPAAGPVWALASGGVLLSYLIGFFGVPAWLLLCLPAIRPLPVTWRRMVWVCLLITLLYGFLFAWQKVFFERNLSHLMPLWAVLFALGARQLVRAMPSRLLQSLGCLLLVILLAERAVLSQGIVSAFFRGSTAVAQQITAYEQNVRNAYPGAVIEWQPMQDPALPDRAGTDVVLRVPHIKLPVQRLLDARMQQAGWTAIGRLPLPYGTLPYNQLQINHAPVAYDYYVKKTSTKNHDRHSAAGAEP